jgi:enolase
MNKIKLIIAREILDSRGNPTIETSITLTSGLTAKASVPSGASTGIYEALELRDHNPKRFGGLGVLKAVKNVNTIIAKKLKGMDVTRQELIDNTLIKLDGTKNKKKLGAKAILLVSLACARTAALSLKQELFIYLARTYKFSNKYQLPTPAFNIFNGGLHASTNLDFQEFMILPIKKVPVGKKIRTGAEVYHALGKILKQEKMDTDLGNEGGYAPQVKSREQVLELIMAAIKKAGYRPGQDVALGLDVGSSELYNQRTKKYELTLDAQKITARQLIDLYKAWIKKYPIISIEDGLAENDWASWQVLTKELGKKILLIGDDLFVTNRSRLQTGIDKRAGNAILIKPNQIGTVSETIQTIRLAQANNYQLMISHRSGETLDDFIADLAVAVGAQYLKSGAPARGERLAKYNRLSEIAKILNK